MIPLNKVNWGPTDALEKDKYFSQKWIETPSIKICILPTNWIVSGEKGSGKSAIRRALSEIYSDRYIAGPIVDFNNITFKVVYDNLVELSNTTRLSKTSTLSHYWQYAMLVELVIASAKVLPEVYGVYFERLPSSKTGISLNQRLLTLLEDAWNKIDEFTGQARSKQKKGVAKSKAANLLSSAGLSASLLSDLSLFPLGDDFTQLKQDFFQQIESRGDRLVLILDGFDRLRNDGAPSDSVQLIFASLVDAIQSIRTDENLPDGLEIKAFIPHDRYIALTLRDFDKVDTMHTAIRWGRDTLKEFLKKRLELTPKLVGDSFPVLWRQVMPERIVNSLYRIEEESFDYLLRHTMMRPRQLQIHLEHLASEYHDDIVDPSGVPKAITESSKKVAQYFINEFRTDHPNLGRFLSSLHQKDNVMEFRVFRVLVEDALKKFHSKQNSLTVEDKIDTLYSMGFFGIINFIEPSVTVGDIYCPPTKESKRYYVDFFYKNPHPSISTTLCDDSVIAFHPILIDYASLRPHPTMIIG
jgi:hypothetical protein